jgi:hypothetical protein
MVTEAFAGPRLGEPSMGTVTRLSWAKETDTTKNTTKIVNSFFNSILLPFHDTKCHAGITGQASEIF